MTDDSIVDMFDKEVAKESPATAYLLTGVRQLLRILDIGLVVPELVACVDDAIATFATDQLPGLHLVEGYPAVPVLLELKQNGIRSLGVYPASSINTIHFASQDELDDYQARGFENVPNALFTFAVTPALFKKSKQGSAAAALPKIDRGALRQNYREYDVLAGLLWDSIGQAKAASEVVALFEVLVTHSGSNNVSAALNEWIQRKAVAGNLSLEDSGLMSAYLHLLGERDIDEGWASADVLEDLAKQVPAAVADSEAFQKWYRYSKSVISNEKELSLLTDDGDVLLRAILLHLLNPDSESIDRMAQRTPAPGAKVLALARTLAATRFGFAPLPAAAKQEFPGAFWLTSDLIAAFINRSEFGLHELIIEKSSKDEHLKWQGHLVKRFAPGTKELVPDEKAKGGVHEDKPAYLSLPALQAMAEALHEVETVSINDGLLELVLTKVIAKPLPKQATFIISTHGEQGVILTSRLLDLTMKSHKTKLTGKRTMAALVYQTEEGSDFRFETRDDEYFSAQITLPSCVEQQILQTALQRLLKCHAWMKKTIK